MEKGNVILKATNPGSLPYRVPIVIMYYVYNKALLSHFAMYSTATINYILDEWYTYVIIQEEIGLCSVP